MTIAAALAATHAAANHSDRAWSATEFANLLNGKGVELVGDAQSFVLVRIIGDEAEILTLATHPDVQRLGHARAQLRALDKVVQRKGVTAVFLEVAADNTPARALYKTMGYLPAGQRPAYYVRTGGVTVDALILRRDLTQG